jgi:ketosteroid isomerase-like protein
VAESNSETMRKAFEGYEAEGWESMLPLLAPDFELTTPPGLAAEPDTYRGEDGMRRYFESFTTGMPCAAWSSPSWRKRWWRSRPRARRD